MLDAMRRFVPWLVLAGCSSQGSLEVIVTDPQGRGAQTVELYVGYSVHHDEDIRPANGELAPTVWWKRDENADLDVEQLEDGRAMFAFLPDGKYNGVAALVAVGYGDDPTTPVGVATRLLWTDIPGNEIHRYELALGGFDPLPRDTRNTPSELPGLRLWGPAEAPTRCVQVDNVPELMTADYADRETGALPASAMIVKLTDPDCDGYERLDDPLENKECVEYEYMAQDAMFRDSLQCAVPEPITNPFGTYRGCVAGGDTCSDGTLMGAVECSPSAYCIPSPLCCADANSCDPYREDVIDGLTVIECDFLARTEGQLYELCPTVSAALLLKTELDMPDLACDSMPGAKLRRGRAGTWQDSVSFGLLSGVTTTVSVASNGDCTFTFSGAGPVIVDPANARMLAAFSVPLAAPSPGRGLMLPIVFTADPVSACPTEPQKLACRINHPSGGRDLALEACIGAPVGPGREVLD